MILQLDDSISMTVDVYGHLVPGANRAAMDRLPTVEESLDGTSSGTEKRKDLRQVELSFVLKGPQVLPVWQ